MGERRCTTCGRDFVPSSGHAMCPACRSKRICACGNEMQLRSVTCWGCRAHGREANGHWKGGRTKHQAGYVMVLFRAHPRAGANGYVFEHVLVMEELLSRYLLPGETVHHLNGVKDDNRPENLELWTRPQPSGIRARDALAWARTIVARYERDLPDEGTAPEP